MADKTGDGIDPWPPPADAKSGCSRNPEESNSAGAPTPPAGCPKPGITMPATPATNIPSELTNISNRRLTKSARPAIDMPTTNITSRTTKNALLTRPRSSLGVARWITS